MKRTLGAVLAALLVGTGLGYLWGSSGTPAGRSDRGRKVDVDRRPAVESPSLEEFLATIPVPTVPTGTGTIRGHVRTWQNEPLQGVRIVATPRESPREPADTSREPTLDESVRRYAAHLKWYELARREARTDAGGAYQVTGLADQGYNLGVTCEGYQIRPEQRSRRGICEPGDEVDFVATRWFEVKIDVFLPDGSRPREAMIHYRGKQRGRESWTPGRPTIRMRGGDYQLSAVAGTSDEYRSAPQQVDLRVGKAVPALVFQLRGRPGVQGRVIVPEELRLEGLQILLSAHRAPHFERIP